MKPYPHQLAMADQASAILREHMLVYLAAEERTGKTLTAVLVAERVNVQRVLVITKKKAVSGWEGTLAVFPHCKQYRVTNYHQAHKHKDFEPDLVILDEAHNYISGYPKVSTTWKTIYGIVYGKPIIYLSATPYAQGYQLLFHQLALSAWSPWRRYKTFYQWFKDWGVPETLYLYNRQVKSYKKVKPQVFEHVKHLFITKTREELGFEHEPEDELHYISLTDKTRLVYNQLLKDGIINLNGHLLMCDTVSKLRVSLHMLEGGVAKIDDKTYLQLGNTEKIDYIKAMWGDSSDVVIMYNYIAEGDKLAKHFKNAEILQSTSYAEGVDLSGYKHLVIYSQDFSTARHTQRRARQANKARKDPIKVHFLLVKDGLSDQVYDCVSRNKVNYVDSLFERNAL